LSDIPEELGLNIKEDVLLLNKRYKRDNPTTSGTFDFFGKKGSDNNMYTQYSKEMLNTGLDFHKNYLNSKLPQNNQTNQQDQNNQQDKPDKNDEANLPMSPLSITESEEKHDLSESANELVKEVIKNTMGEEENNHASNHAYDHVRQSHYDHVRHSVHYDEKEG
jgi:hypothetical protein